MLPWWLKETLNIIQNNNPDLVLHKNSSCHNCRKLNYNSSDWNLIFTSQKDYFNYLWDWYNFDKHSFMHIENLQTFLSLICIDKSYYETNIKNIENDQYWGKNFDRFSFSQNLVAHFENCKKPIILLEHSYIQEWICPKKTWYNTTNIIVKDIKMLYLYYEKKYELNDNFKKLMKASIKYRQLCIIYGFLKKIFWENFVKFISKIYYKIIY